MRTSIPGLGVSCVSLLLSLAFFPVGATAGSARNRAEEKLASLVESIRHADYRGDREQLRKLATELAALQVPKYQPQQEYWVGFAWWRRAINGFNETPTPADLLADLRQCEDRNRFALRAAPEFEDALNALVSCLGVQIGLARSAEVRNEVLSRGGGSFQKLRDLGATTTNPRTLWVLAAWEATAPPVDLAKSLATLVRGLEQAHAQASLAHDPWTPAWGEAELLMSLAYMNTLPGHQDRSAARAFAAEARRLAPDWHYLRDILIPQIEALAEPSTVPTPR